jgi:radical SAM protein with 4Fe4S-binding SPASM domain
MMKVEQATAHQVVFTGDIHFDVASGALRRGPAEVCGDPPAPLVIRTGYAEAVPQLQLSMTDACNMECSYCSFRARVHADGKPVNMPMETAHRAIEMFAGEVARDASYARVDFGLAGEPMLRRRAHGTLMEWIAEALQRAELTAAWAGPMVTNATLARHDRELAESLGPPQDISCDGPREVHDAFRPYADGSGTYDDVVAVIRQVLARHPGIGGSAVLTARFHHFDEIFLHLHEVLGFQSIYMKPVNVSPDVDYGLNPDTLPRFQEGYRRLVDLILAQPAPKRLSYLLTLSPDDFFMRYFYRLLNRGHQIYRCGAGKSGAYVDTNGKLYPCAHFIGKSGWDIGDVEHGFDESKRRKFFEAHVDTREPCRSCWARYLCGGGCYYQAVLTNGHFDTPDLAKCDLIRFLCTEAVRLLSALEEETPEVLAALPLPYVVAAADADAPASTVYLPSAILVPAGDDFELNRFPSCEGRIFQAAQSARLRIEHVGNDLLLRLRTDVPWTSLEIWLVDTEQVPFRFVDLVAATSSVVGIRLRALPDGSLSRAIAPPGTVRKVPFPPQEWRAVGSSVQGPDGLELQVPLAELFGGVMPARYGLNVSLFPTSGGRLVLVRREPFLRVLPSRPGPLRPAGGEFDLDTEDGTLNARAMDAFIPITRWTGLQANVC